ncbi:MAG TPA: twin-arginine translocase TatA/TatE family subunit [Acidimicrobiia bacterium]|nr:twin-arginine translocase TatA/TatE family subunit [Acidimicrobiia bacterium]
MNANLTLSEILTIAVVILIVFGPQRLPEMARKAGEIVGKLRDAAGTLRTEFTREFEDVAQPLKDIEADLKAAKEDLRGAMPDLKGLESGVASAGAAPPADEQGAEGGTSPSAGDNDDES